MTSIINTVKKLTDLERQALHKIYVEHNRKVYSIIVGYFGRFEADAILKDFFGNIALKKIDKLDKLKNERYICRSITNFCIDRLRSTKKGRMIEPLIGSIDLTKDSNLVIYQTSNDDYVHYVNQKIELIMSVPFLNDTERLILKLYLKDYSMKEINKITGLSNASKKRRDIEKKLSKYFKSKK